MKHGREKAELEGPIWGYLYHIAAQRAKTFKNTEPSKTV